MQLKVEFGHLLSFDLHTGEFMLVMLFCISTQFVMYLLNGYKTDIDSVTCLVCGMTFKEVFTFIYGVSIKVCMSS